ncbi:MAG: YlbF family regulator [Megasphaera elsdenii]|nr:YlbF family regulator [Megasphaera elsdenii]
MEIYDKAHELEVAIKECQEYKDLVAAGQELAKDEKTKHLVRDFLMLQAQLAYAQSMGDKPIRKKIDHLNQMAELIKNNQTAVEYLNHYNKWQTMAGEVFQIIQNAMAEGMSILDQ